MRKISLLLIVAFFTLFSGCSNQPIVVDHQLSDPHVRYENPRLYKWLKFDFINYIQRDDGMLEFEARFINTSKFNKSLAYKVNWKNANGFIQKTLMSRWVFAEVETTRSFVVHGISPNPKSKDFEIILQEPTKDDALRKDSYRSTYQH